MNEYYKRRYNLTKYFINLDNILTLLYGLIYILIIILAIFTIVIFNNNINTTTAIYLIFLILLIIISYVLISTIKNTQTHEIFINYNNYYELLNCIFKENLKFSIKIYNTYDSNKKIRELNKNSDLYKIFLIKKELLSNINNIENIYGKDAEILLINTPDIIKYYDIEKYITQGFHKRIYFNINDISFINKNGSYINKTNDYYQYIDLELIETSNENVLLLNYMNKKYNKNFNYLYKSPEYIFMNFNLNIDKVLDKLKQIIYIYILICIFFIIIILHGLFINFNNILTYTYLLIIMILLLLLYSFISY